MVRHVGSETLDNNTLDELWSVWQLRDWSIWTASSISAITQPLVTFNAVEYFINSSVQDPHTEHDRTLAVRTRKTIVYILKSSMLTCYLLNGTLLAKTWKWRAGWFPVVYLDN